MITREQLDAAVYRKAEQLLRHNRTNLVLGGTIRPRWIDGGDRFWYVLRTATGKQFVLVDPRGGHRNSAFDHERLAKALAAASGEVLTGAALPFDAIDLRGEAVEFDAFGARWRCRLDTYECGKVECERAGAAPALGEVPSPDGRFTVFRRGYDVWVRSLADGREWALTTDGEADYDYGTEPDAMKQTTLLSKLGLPDPLAVAWSPDSTRVLVPRTDHRGVRRVHLIESYPADGSSPRLRTKRYPYPGDNRVPLTEFLVFDIAAGTCVCADDEPIQTPLGSPILTGSAWWSADESAVYYLAQPRDLRILHLRRLDPATGQVRTVVTETGDTRVEANQFWGLPPIVAVLPTGEVLWYSQRDGWGHLYLYDPRSGEPRGQVTSGEWAVREILHVDEERRVVYFLASGLVATDPYRRSVCRVGLDGTAFARVTDDELDHAVTISPDGEYFLDSASTVSTAPVTTVRGWDGRALVELERADITRLVAAGWTPPQHFQVTAADGHTDLYGVLHLPPDFDPTASYPVIDHPYPGPQSNRVGAAFHHEYGIFTCAAEAMAALGFVVVAVDGRGTPGRSKAFHDASYRRMSDAGSLDDHIATLRQLARTRPWMDLERVGIVGLSAGGFATVRAMLDHPEVYKVGVAGCGCHDNRCYHLSYGERYDGPYDAQTYARTSPVDGADRLQGKLLLIHGGLDDNVYAHQTLRLVDRLIAANKDFDMCIVPGADHLFLGYEHYLNQRTWDFLVRHLLRAEPPDCRLTPIPLDDAMAAEFFG